MEHFQGIQAGPLSITRKDTAQEITLLFSGKSILRSPVEFLQPILLQVVEESSSQDKRLILDFSQLTYMNSSTFTPIVKTMERVRSGSAQLSVVYDGEAKWQAVSFHALEIFATADGRVSVKQST